MLAIINIVDYFANDFKNAHSVNVDSGIDKSIPEKDSLLDLKNFQYLISKPPCNVNGKQPRFVTLVHSSPRNFDYRMASRETWAHSNNNTLTYFVMGAVRYPSIQKRIEKEDAQYHDIIQGYFWKFKRFEALKTSQTIFQKNLFNRQFYGYLYQPNIQTYDGIEMVYRKLSTCQALGEDRR